MKYRKNNPLFKAYTVVSLLLLVFCPSLHASMVGDVLTISRLYPDLNTNYDVPPKSTTVSVGASDVVTVQNLELFDPEANSISIDWFSSSFYVGDAITFDGFRFTGFSSVIQNVMVINVTNISIAELAVGSNFINLNLTGAFDSSSFIRLQVDFAPVPIPSAIWFFGSSLLSFMGMRKKLSLTA